MPARCVWEGWPASQSAGLALYRCTAPSRGPPWFPAVQLVAASQAAGAVPSPAWHAAWRRVAAAHAAAHAGGALVSQMLACRAPAGAAWTLLHPGSGCGAPALLRQLLWAAVAGLAAAEGPPALLAALTPSKGSGAGNGNAADSCSTGEAAPGSAEGGQRAPSGSSPGAVDAEQAAVQRCTVVVALTAAVLQGSHLLLAHWVRCAAFLLAVLPLHALASQRRAGGAGGLAAGAALLSGAATLSWQLYSGGAVWLACLLLPHLILGLV